MGRNVKHTDFSLPGALLLSGNVPLVAVYNEQYIQMANGWIVDGRPEGQSWMWAMVLLLDDGDDVGAGLDGME